MVSSIISAFCGLLAYAAAVAILYNVLRIAARIEKAIKARRNSK